jgi:SAM-dependent methyltransferase
LRLTRVAREEPVAQNIYDDPAFFDAYGKVRRSTLGLEGAPEWPALRALLPPMGGARVADLGCGYGWFCRWAGEAGAGSVLGVDVSQRMLEKAEADTSDERVRFLRADLDELDLPGAAFDLAYSSLALHYVEDFDRRVGCVHRALAPGGRFVFSIEHPIYMAPERPGWITLEDGRRVWPLDSYGREGPRSTRWLVDGVIKHHRTLGTTLNALIRRGFVIRHVEEWKPSQAQLDALPAAAEELDRPMFLLVAADRPSGR